MDSEFVEAVRRCIKAEESFKEQLGLEKTHDNPREKGWGRGQRNKNITFKENKPSQDVWVWIMACEDFFGQNAWQWEEGDERIKYALSMIEGGVVTPFAITYRKKMTGDFSFP